MGVHGGLFESLFRIVGLLGHLGRLPVRVARRWESRLERVHLRAN